MNHMRIRDEPRTKRRKKSESPTRVRQKGAKFKGKGEHGYVSFHGSNIVMLADLCKEFGIDPQRARILLRESELEHTGRWKWKLGTKELARARAILKEGVI